VYLVLDAVTGAIVLRDQRDLAILLRPHRLRSPHRALAFEDDPFVDDEARCGDIAEELSGRAYLVTRP